MPYKKHLAVQTAINIVCEEFELSEKQLLHKTKHQKIAMPRQVVMWLVRSLRNRPGFAQIGRDLNGLNHATVLHGVNGIKNRRETEKAFCKRTDALLAKFTDQIGEDRKSSKVAAEWITNEYVGHTRTTITDLQEGFNAIANHVRTDAVMEGWRKKQIVDKLDAIKPILQILETLPKYRNSLFNEVNLELKKESKND